MKTYTITVNGNVYDVTYINTASLKQAGLLAYSTSTTYNEGDYVYHSDTDLTIYRCNTANTTGTWDSTKWDAKTYMEYLQDIIVNNALGGSY